MHHITILQFSRRSHENSLMQVRVKLLGLALDLLARVESLQTVLLKGVHENVLGHLEASNELKELLVLFSLGGIELFRGYSQQRTVEVVNALQEILGEALDGKVTGIVHVALGTLLEVAELGNRAEIFVLIDGIISYQSYITSVKGKVEK